MNDYLKQPLYAIFIKEDDTLKGYIEHSFFMDYSRTFVRLWSKKDFLYILDKDPHLRKKPYILTRIRSKKCPVEINFEEDLSVSKKFNSRNKRFTLKSK